MNNNTFYFLDNNENNLKYHMNRVILRTQCTIISSVFLPQNNLY